MALNALLDSLLSESENVGMKGLTITSLNNDNK